MSWVTSSVVASGIASFITNARTNISSIAKPAVPAALAVKTPTATRPNLAPRTWNSVRIDGMPRVSITAATK